MPVSIDKRIRCAFVFHTLKFVLHIGTIIKFWINWSKMITKFVGGGWKLVVRISMTSSNLKNFHSYTNYCYYTKTLIEYLCWICLHGWIGGPHHRCVICYTVNKLRNCTNQQIDQHHLGNYRVHRNQRYSYFWAVQFLKMKIRHSI